MVSAIVYAMGLFGHVILVWRACVNHREPPTWRTVFFTVAWPVTFCISLWVGYKETCT